MDRAVTRRAYGAVILAALAVACAPAAGPGAGGQFRADTAEELADRIHKNRMERWRNLIRRAEQASHDFTQWERDGKELQRRWALLEAHPAWPEYSRKVFAVLAQAELEPQESPAWQRLFDEFHARLTPTEFKLQDAFLRWRKEWDAFLTRREGLEQTRRALLREYRALEAERERARHESEQALLEQQLRTLQTERTLAIWESWQRLQRFPRLECWTRSGPLGAFTECR